MNVAWLTAYPKSGVTWLSAFLYHYFYGEPETSRAIQDTIPDIYRLTASGYSLNENLPNTIMCKTHLPYSSQHPHINDTFGFIYILRHPKDILLSTINYANLVDFNIDKFTHISSFIQTMGENDLPESWVTHVGSWFAASAKHSHLFLRYEEMRRDPKLHFRHVIEFLGHVVDEEKLEQAVEFTSFANMRKLEEQEKAQNVADTIFPGSTDEAKKGHYFVNKGAIGQNLKHISEELDQQFDARFAQVLSMLGYDI